MVPEDLAELVGPDRNWEEELPFEYLDPCCQREVLQRRRHDEVSRALRPVDRSQQRLDAARSVLTQVGEDPWQCGCCNSSEDYGALRRLKEQLGVLSGKAEVVTASDDASVGSDDSDLDNLDFLVPLTAEEQERMDRVLRETREREMAQQSPLRLALHLEESVGHLMTLLQRLPDIPIVVHVYQNDTHSALVDFALERVLAPKYLGTMFRRLSCSAALSFHEMGSHSTDLVEAFNSALVDHRRCVMAFLRGKQVALLGPRDVDDLGDTPDLVTRHLHRALEHAHVLCEDLPVAVVRPQVLLDVGLTRALAEDERDEERFCDDPDCTKRFAHEHVGRKANGRPAPSGPSFLLSQGQDVFARGAMQRM